MTLATLECAPRIPRRKGNPSYLRESTISSLKSASYPGNYSGNRAPGQASSIAQSCPGLTEFVIPRDRKVSMNRANEDRAIEPLLSTARWPDHPIARFSKWKGHRLLPMPLGLYPPPGTLPNRLVANPQELQRLRVVQSPAHSARIGVSHRLLRPRTVAFSTSCAEFRMKGENHDCAGLIPPELLL